MTNQTEIINNILNITIHRKFHLHGILVPFYIIFDYNVDEFNQLINKYNNDEITKEQLKNKLKEINMLPIKNNENKKIEISNNNTKVFITNMNIENTKMYPLICSNQLIINKDAELVFKISKSLTAPKFSLINITKNEENNKQELLNIEKTNTIDGIAIDNENNKKLLMLLADGMDWSDEYNHLLLLEEKINNYIAYIESKQYLEKYEDIELIEIQIKFLFKETDNCEKFLEQVKKVINNSLQNINLSIEHGVEETFK